MSGDARFHETVELLRRAKAGEEECLGRVLEHYREPVLARIRRMMGREARRIAESGDFLHDVFVRILEKFEDFELRDERAFLHWAVQIAQNSMRNRVRKERVRVVESLVAGGRLLRRGGPEDTRPTPSGEAMREEQLERLAGAIAELNEDQQLVLELRYGERLPFGEIARRMGRTENAVQLLHARVVTRLSAALADESS